MAESIEFCVEVARLPPKDLPWTEAQRVAVLPKDSAHAASSSEAGAAGVQQGCRRGGTCVIGRLSCESIRVCGGSFNCTGGRTLSFSMYPRVTSTSFRISLACAQPLRRHLKGTDTRMQAVLGERERERRGERTCGPSTTLTGAGRERSLWPPKKVW